MCVLRDASISLLGPPGHADSVSFLDPGDNSIVDGKASVKKKIRKKNTLELYKWMDIITVHGNNFFKYLSLNAFLSFFKGE